jgi:hypothetical protein
MLLVLGVVLAATYLLLRRAPLPERVDVGPWARGGGRLIAGSGAAGLIVMTVAIAGTGDGGLLVFLLLTTFTLPPLAAATAGLRSGWRLARNIRSSRVPALMSGVSVTVCAGFWTWFWPNLDTGKSWLIHTEARQNVGAAVIALVGLSSAIGTLLVARRLPVPTPLPAQAPARTTVRRRRELAPALITTGLIVNLIVAFSSSTRAEFHVSAAEGGSGDGSCSALLDVVTQPLSSVEYGWPRWSVQAWLLRCTPATGWDRARSRRHGATRRRRCWYSSAPASITLATSRIRPATPSQKPGSRRRPGPTP